MPNFPLELGKPMNLDISDFMLALRSVYRLCLFIHGFANLHVPTRQIGEPVPSGGDWSWAPIASGGCSEGRRMFWCMASLTFKKALECCFDFSPNTTQGSNAWDLLAFGGLDSLNWGLQYPWFSASMGVPGTPTDAKAQLYLVLTTDALQDVNKAHLNFHTQFKYGKQCSFPHIYVFVGTAIHFWLSSVVTLH